MNRAWQKVLQLITLANLVTISLLAHAQTTLGEGHSGKSSEPKDAATIISAIALLISIGVLVFNWWSWRRKNIDDTKKALTEAIVGMIAARQKLEEFRSSSGEEFGSVKFLSYRIALTDQRQLYLSKALQILTLHERKLSPSYFEYMMLAANLIDLGRTADSVKYYKKGLTLAEADSDEVASASTRRVYGRAQIASGDYDRGRKEMVIAAGAYEALASRQAYDRDWMLGEAAETYRRLIWVQIQADQMAAVNDDLHLMEALVARIKHPMRHRQLTSGLDEVRAALTKEMRRDDRLPVTNAQAEPDQPTPTAENPKVDGSPEHKPSQTDPSRYASPGSSD